VHRTLAALPVKNSTQLSLDRDHAAVKLISEEKRKGTENGVGDVKEFS
jgi:hypothetical protein